MFDVYLFYSRKILRYEQETMQGRSGPVQKIPDTNGSRRRVPESG